MGSSLFARRYLGNRVFFLFLRVLRCFSSPGLPSSAYVFNRRYLGFALGGFPHSDIPGSMSTCDSPRRFGAYPVLLRLLVPRHSPYALNNLTSKIVICNYFCLLCSFQGTSGGDEEIRTPDPLLARQVLSQLSYTPTSYLRFEI